MTPSRTRAHTSRWDLWQSTPVATSRLSADDLEDGYTIVRVPLQTRDAFLDAVRLLLAIGRLLRVTTPTEALKGWHAWCTYTRRLAAYCERLAEHKPVTVPPLPEELPHE